ncbi:MAG: polysaccharide biosynthesis C-terminal domain-containing protein, partial [Bacteroidota bacterium]|nr:polysaccharide biosynthesis C-terminal domain-containing protein [Bacteroidota bacterium]
NFIGGPAIVYLMPRFDAFRLLVPSYMWAFLCSSAGSVLLSVTGLVPAVYAFDVFWLSLLVTITSVNLNILLAKERFTMFNILSTLQILVTITVLIWFVFMSGIHTITAYLWSFYIGIIVSFVVSLMAIRNLLHFSDITEIPLVVVTLLKYSPFMQFGTIFQMLNYRLSYYIIERFFGSGLLGIYTVGTQVSESVWILGRSAATVHYARMSNTNDMDYARDVTLAVMKGVTIITLFLLIIMVLLPQGIYVFLFGAGFAGARAVVLLLAPGMLFTTVTMIISHYFSGIGLPRYSMYGSAIGLVLTLSVGFLLIPVLGIKGAALTTSLSYLACMCYLFTMFIKKTGTGLKNFMLKRSDFELLRMALAQSHGAEIGSVRKEGAEV